MFKFRRVSYTALMLFLVSTSYVFAAGDTNPEARKHFAAGANYQKAGKLDLAVQEYRAGLKLEPNSVMALGNLGIIYTQRKQLSNAESAFGRIVAADPKNEPATEQLVRILLMEGKAKEAIPPARALVGMKPKEPRYQQLLAGCAAMSKDYATAEGIYRSLIHTDPKNPAYYEGLIGCYMSAQDYAGGLAAAQSMLKMDPSSARAKMTAAFAAEKAGDKAAAIKYYELVKSGPSAPSALLNLARLYKDVNQPEKSVAALKSILKIDKNNVEANFNLGAYEYSKQRWSEAEKYWAEAKRARPTDPTINLNLGLVLARQGKFKEALACTTIATNGMPKSPLAFEAHGYVLECLGQFDKAMQVYKRWEKADPGSYLPNQKIALNYIYLKKPANAWPQFDLAMKKAPKSTDVAATYAGLLAGEKEYAKAHKIYAKAMELDPKNTSIVIGAANCLDSDKKQAEAIKLLEKAVSTYPSDAALRRRLAKGYSAQNNNDPAIAQFKKLFDDDPKAYDDGAALAQLYTQKGDHKAAAEVYRGVLKSCPKEAQAFYRFKLGSALEKTNDYDEAISAYKESITASPIDGEVYEALGKLYAGQNKQEEYLAFLRPIIADAKDPLPFNYFADAFRKAGKADEGIAALEAVAKRMPDNTQLALVLASEYAKSNQTDKAINGYKAVLDKFADPTAYVELGNLYLKTGKEKEAADCFVAVTGNKALILQAADIYYYKLPDQRTAALNAYRNYLALDPANEEVKKKVSELEAGQTPTPTPSDPTPVVPVAPVTPAPVAPGGPAK